MTKTATIINLFCVKPSSGTDLSTLSPAVVDAIRNVLPRDLGPSIDPYAAVGSVFGLMEALDSARSDPDNLYLTSESGGGLGASIWPSGGGTHDLQGLQSAQPHVSIEFDDQTNLSLWDYDSSSDDDLLGSIQILESEESEETITKFAYSEIESSAYYVSYRVQ